MQLRGHNCSGNLCELSSLWNEKVFCFQPKTAIGDSCLEQRYNWTSLQYILIHTIHFDFQCKDISPLGLSTPI